MVNSAKRAKGKRITDDYKASRGCYFCDEKDPNKLVFHNDGKATIDWLSIGKMVNDCWDGEFLKGEAERRIVVCRSCKMKLRNGTLTINKRFF